MGHVECDRKSINPIKFLREEKLESWNNWQVVPRLAHDDIRSWITQETGVLHGGHDRGD